MSENDETIPLKGAWQVRAGIIPGTPMEEYDKKFFYTSGDYAADQDLPEGGTNRFTEKMLEAHEYSKELTQPQYVNWVELTWIWY